MDTKHQQGLGIALGGGAVLGAVHIGVLKALEERSVFPGYVAGTSIGAFIGALYAFGKTASEIEAIATRLDWMDVSKISLSKYSLLSNSRLGDLLVDTLGDVSVESAERKLGIVATDLLSGKKVLITKGDLSRAVMASTCVPGLYRPITWDDHILVDGGIVEHVPSASVRELGAAKVITVDLTRHCNKPPNNIIDILMNTFSITMMQLAKGNSENSQLVIAPDLSEFNLMDTRKIPQLIELGYCEAGKALDTMENKL